MAATFAVIGEAFGGATAAAGAAEVGVGAAAEGVAAGAAADMAAGGVVEAGLAGGAAAGAGAATSGSILGTLGSAVATAGATQLVGSVLAPKTKAPSVGAPLAMPDPLAQQKAIQNSIVQQIARRGRASTVLTDGGGGKLGG